MPFCNVWTWMPHLNKSTSGYLKNQVDAAWLVGAPGSWVRIWELLSRQIEANYQIVSLTPEFEIQSVLVSCKVRGSEMFGRIFQLAEFQLFGKSFFNWAIPGLFFFIFVCSGLQLTYNYVLILLLLSGFELWISGGGCNRSANCATTMAIKKWNFYFNWDKN